MESKQLSASNSAFWDELCGTTTAQQLGIADRSLGAITAFDDWYFRYYSYLKEYLFLDELSNKKLIEVGLGYGSVATALLRAGARYTGVDIANGPIEMMEHRSRLFGLNGQFLHESFFDVPLPAESHDYLISIGCFHHTGNLQGCIDKAHSLLKTGGTLIFMVYNRYGYKQWLRWPLKTAANWLYDRGLLKKGSAVTEEQRRRYDENSSGEAAPETEFFSCTQLRTMLHGFSSVKIYKENVDDLPWPFRLLLRRRLLLPWFGRLWGRDLYIIAKK